MPWWHRRVPVARAAQGPVLVSSLLSLTARWTGIAVLVDLLWQP